MSEQQAITFSDAHLDTREKPRLSAQCIDILKRMLQGPVTNQELSGIALKYTSRISDIRASGISVLLVERDHETGRTVYDFGTAEARARAVEICG